MNAAGKRHGLVEHLTAVASLAARFAQDLGAEELGRYAGIWHDLGKFHPAFQEYLRSCEANPLARGHGPDHKGAGALLASRHFAGISALIQGHHGGLRARTDLKGWLAEKEKDVASRYALELATAAIPDLEPVGQLALPEHVLRDPRSAELFLRLVFSALVDADYLDTERHFRADQAAERRGAARSVAELWDCLERHQRQFSGEPSGAAVARARRDVYEACVAAAESAPGLFRLTVPTGGGKTLSGMAFALRHATPSWASASDRGRALHHHHGADRRRLQRYIRRRLSS